MLEGLRCNNIPAARVGFVGLVMFFDTEIAD